MTSSGTPPYRPREITSSLRRALATMPVVALTGMRQVGKSTLLRREPTLAGRRYLSLDDFATLEAARRDPEALLAGEEPITIDEAQKASDLLSVIKQSVDRDRRPGRFLLSGSANFALLQDVAESLAGRAVYLVLSPFSRREIEGTTGQTPFLVGFANRPSLPPVRPSARRVEAAEVLAGGMPSVCLGQVVDPSLWYLGFVQTYLERDIRDLARVADLVSLHNLLVLTALRTGQVLNISGIARDAKLKSATATRHLGLLEASFVVRRLGPFLANRATRLIKSPKLYMTDPGLVCHLAGLTEPAEAERDPLWGALLETWVALNLLSILEAHWPTARLHFWNVQGRHEVDFVIEAGRTSLAIEVKAAARWDERDLSGLRALLAATPGCQAAILAHNGTDAVSLGDRLWAIPLGMIVG